MADRKQIAIDFKQVYWSKDKKTAQKKLASFIGKWGKKYPSIKNSLISNQLLLTFYDYPKSVRSTIYTTSLKEGNNKRLKRNFKKKEKFPNNQSQKKYLVCEFNKFKEKHMNHVHRGFGQTVSSDWFEDLAILGRLKSTQKY